ncbi:hypothetical protein TNCV_4130631 [Trichonephila clavipes]|nr:hypothetical protein TNCV_4130631 [Trichonephila clavipes]
MARKRAENREGSLGYPGFVKPVFTKDSKSLGKRKISLGYLGIVTPYSPKEVEPLRGKRGHSRRRKKITGSPPVRETRSLLKKLRLKCERNDCKFGLLGGQGPRSELQDPSARRSSSLKYYERTQVIGRGVAVSTLILYSFTLVASWISTANVMPSLSTHRIDTI